jgi:DNA mismatch repair protein MutS2
MDIDVNLQQLEVPALLGKLKELIRTPYGQKHLDEIELEKDSDTLEIRLTEVTEMVGLMEGGYGLPLSGSEDIRPFLNRLKPKESYLEPTEIIHIKSYLHASAELSQFIKSSADKCPNLFVFAEKIHFHRQLVKEIEATIDSRGEIQENASPELRRIKKEIHKLESEQKTVLLRVIKKYSDFSQDDIVTLRDGRMVLGIQQQYLNRINGIVHGTSGTGATIFVEPMETLRISNQIQSLKLQERNEIIRILRFLSGLIREIKDDIFFSLENFGRLDFIHAKGKLSQALKASRPSLNKTNTLKLINARHPLLLLKMDYQDVIPSTVEVGEDYKTLIITGPNAGGKTVALKMAGILCVMAALGMHIPANAESSIPILDHILVDIGDRQNLEQDLSTFSAHIIRLHEILEQATKKSLVLIDEIGTGTDPREGSALAIAYLQELTQRKALTIATTHHGELKAFAYNTKNVENASMEFNLDNLLPTYRLQLGIPGSSYAFEIAKRFGLSAKVLDKAVNILGTEKNQLESLIISLNDRLQQAEKERREINIKLTESEGLQKLYQNQVEKIEKEKTDLRRDAAREAKNIVDEANKTIEKLIADIRKSAAQKEQIKEAHQTLDQLRKNTRQILKETEQTPETLEEFNLGDIIWIENLREEGEIISEPDDDQKAWVLVRDMRMNLSLKESKKLHKKESTSIISRKRSAPISETVGAGVLPELDLRGMDSYAAVEATSLYIDQAMENGWEEIRIIHGKGTGVLRKEINKFLQKDNRILSKRLGRWGEGDTGVTIVKLKD